MKTLLLVSLMTFLVAMSLVSVFATNSLSITVNEVKVNGIDITGSNTLAGEAGEVVPVSVYFTAGENASEVEISAWMQGRRSNAVTENFRDLIDGKDYIGRLSLQLPSDIDPEEDLTLYIRIESDAGNWEESYEVAMQRQPYNAEVLFVELDNTVSAGQTVPVDVVIKNLGRHDLEDLVVAISVPEIGLIKKAYFGDLTPKDICNNNSNNNDDCDNEDATERIMNLNMPANVKAGIYELVVEAYNADTKSTVKQNIMVVGSEQTSNVLVPIASKELASGETATYDLIIVNPGNSLGVYEIIPETAEGVMVSVANPIVTVRAGESEVVKVQVKAGSKEGTFSFGVNVNSDSTLVKRVLLNANVTGKALASNVTVLTIVLAIIFVVLLIVLIVLLTRKPMRAEELEESYY